MSNTIVINQIEINLTQKENVIFTDSLAISSVFGKEHFHVLRDIEALPDFKERLGELKIELTSYTDKSNRQSKMYLLDIDACIYLTEHLRANTDNRVAFLQELYRIKGETVIIQGQERRELEFIRELCYVLDALKIRYIKQFNISKYRIDLYLPEYKVAIEFDEYHHNESKDLIRESEIKDLINEIKFIRVPDELELGQGIGLVLKSINKLEKKVQSNNQDEPTIEDLDILIADLEKKIKETKKQLIVVNKQLNKSFEEF